MATEPTEAQIAEFLQAIGRMVGQTVNLPDFDSLYVTDDEESGPGLVRHSPDDIEAMLVMTLQRAEMEQKQADEEARAIRQSEAIGIAQQRADTPPALPDGPGLLMLEPAAVEDAVTRIDDGHAACAALANAFGATDADFDAALAETEAAFLARDEAVQQLHDALARVLAERQAQARQARAAFEALRGQLGPEAAKLVEAGKTKGQKNLKLALASVEEALKTLDESVSASPPSEFEQRLEAVDLLQQGMAKRIEEVNKQGVEQRGRDRKERADELVWGSPRPESLALHTLTDAEAGKPFTTALAAFDKARNALVAELKTAEPEAFERLVAEARRLRDDAEGELQDVRGLIDAQSRERARSVAALRQQKDALPENKTRSGTPEHTELNKAVGRLGQAISGLDRLVANGARKAFEDALGQAQTLRDQTEADIVRLNRLGKDRSDRLDALRAELRLHSATRQAHAVPPGFLPGDAILTAFEPAFQAAAKRIFTRLAGLDDEADRRVAEEFRQLVSHAIEFGQEIRRNGALTIAQVHANMLVAAQTADVVNVLGSSGVGASAIDAAKRLRTLLGQLGDDYRRFDDLAPDVTTATVTHAGILPAQQLVLAQYAAQTAPLALHALDRAALALLAKKFRTAVTLVLDEAQRLADAATPMGVFLALYAANRANNQPAVLVALTNLLNAGTAVVAAGRDAYQCENENGGNFSVERVLRIGGRSGVLIHAHCYPDGNVKHGNGFHIKLASDRHQTGRGVMLAHNSASRGLLLAAFGAQGNLNEKDATDGVVWR